MYNTDAGDVRKRLATLSDQERSVLTLRCKGADYKTIADTLHIALPTVKQYMSRIYVKLGLDQLSRTERTKALFETFCPAFEEATLPRVEGEAVEEPVPPSVEKMVDEDENAIILARPQPTQSMPISSPSKRRNRSGFRTLAIGVVLGICLSGGAVVLILRPNILAEFTDSQSTPTTQFTSVEPQESPSPVPENATQTPVIIEQFVVVTATPLPATLPPAQPPAPSIALPFSDNFDNGASPNWKVLSGTWLTVDGRYTTLPDDNGWQWSVLSDPTWKNYRVLVNIYLPHIFSANQGKIAIAARVSSSQPKYLSLYVDNIRTQAGWAFVGNDYSVYDYVSGPAEDVPQSANIELEVRDNQFTARLNGRDIQTITLTGYEQGGAALGIYCDATGCPSFDDFEIETVSQ